MPCMKTYCSDQCTQTLCIGYSAVSKGLECKLALDLARGPQEGCCTHSFIEGHTSAATEYTSWLAESMRVFRRKLSW